MSNVELAEAYKTHFIGNAVTSFLESIDSFELEKIISKKCMYDKAVPVLPSSIIYHDYATPVDQGRQIFQQNGLTPPVELSMMSFTIRLMPSCFHM